MMLDSICLVLGEVIHHSQASPVGQYRHPEQFYFLVFRTPPDFDKLPVS